jgi:hypothetical protein
LTETEVSAASERNDLKAAPVKERQNDQQIRPKSLRLTNSIMLSKISPNVEVLPSLPHSRRFRLRLVASGAGQCIGV